MVANPFSRVNDIERLVDTTSNVGNLIDDAETPVSSMVNGESTRKRQLVDESQGKSGRKQMKRHEGDSTGESSRQSPENNNRGMTRQMRDFYDNSWGGENFSVGTLQSNMPSKKMKKKTLDSF